MSQLSPEQIWNLPKKELLQLLETNVTNRKSGQIHFYAPSFTYFKNKHFHSKTTDFPSISVTGNTCSLNCKHCGGKVLETMHPAIAPEVLFDLGKKLKSEGAKGVLVSGGCLPDGSVPLDSFIPVLARFKGELELTVLIHTGIINTKEALTLKKSGVDAALIDVIGSSDTVKKIYNLNIDAQDYSQSLLALQKAKIPFVPHVIVGLDGGKLNGEFKALKMINQVQPSAIVIIAFMPIHGTEMENVPPPEPLDIARVAAVARKMFPSTPLVLGCMRPKGKSRGQTDILALGAGVDGIAFPNEAAVEYAKTQGLGVVFSSFCCAQIYLDAIKEQG
jgi:uncharacterized radical SAM superfamily protein